MCDGHEIAHLVADREVDLGFGISQTSRHGLLSEIVHVDPLVLVVAPDHILSQKRTIRIQELSSERFYMHSRNTTMIETVQRLFASYNVQMNVAARLWKFDTIKHFVRTGGGVAIVPTSVVRSELEDGSLVAIAVDELEITRSIEVIYRERDVMLPAPMAFLKLLRTWPWRQYAPAPGGAGLANTHNRISRGGQQELCRPAV